MPNLSLNYKVHNNYKFELVDAKTGNVKKTAKAENVVCNAFYTQGNIGYALGAIRLGTGTGTPAATDTALFTQKYVLSATKAVSEYSNSTLLVTLTATSPLGNTGVFTEVGLGLNSNNYALLTHALITDAEDNPITVEQTDTDILNITAYVYFELTCTDGVQTYMVPTVKYLAEAFNTLSSSASNPQGRMFVPNRVAIALADCITNKDVSGATAILSPTQVGGFSVSGGAYRLGVDTGNVGFYQFMLIAPVYSNYNASNFYTKYLGYLEFPNSTVFPPYAVTGIPVGTGDGTTTGFKAPFDIFVDGSDTIYVNGTAKTRNVDYTISNATNNNRRICISAGNRAVYSSTQSQFDSTANWFNNATVIGSTSGDPSISALIANTFTKIDLSLLADKRVNAIYMPRLYAQYVSGGSVRMEAFNGTVTFQTSDDDVTYEDAATVSFVEGIPQTYPVTFATPITDKYWRFSYYSSSSLVMRGSVYPQTVTGDTYTSARFFGYTEPYAINFTTAPAADAVITMDCSLDRPYKSSNYVIDLQGTMTITNS